MNAAAVPAGPRSLPERALPWTAAVLFVAAVPAGFLVEAAPARRFVVPRVAPEPTGRRRTAG